MAGWHAWVCLAGVDRPRFIDDFFEHLHRWAKQEGYGKVDRRLKVGDQGNVQFKFQLRGNLSLLF